MELVAIEDRRRIRTCFRQLRSALIDGAERRRRRVGFPGGSRMHYVFWIRKHGFWSILDDSPWRNRYWCSFGVQSPDVISNLSITCEINPPREGIDRRCGGVFAEDGEGRVHVLHSGKIGGGGKGIGKDAFSDFAHLPRLSVSWSDGHNESCFLAGTLDSRVLVPDVAAFVYEVQRFKSAMKRGWKPAPTSFTPEFEGRRAPWARSGTVEASVIHGKVINQLHNAIAAIKKPSWQLGKDRQRDLFITTANGRTLALFESKTDVTPYSFYTGVGQLLLNSAASRSSLVKILVLPARPTSRTRAALTNLGILTVAYSIRGRKVTFTKLDQILGAALGGP